MAQPSPDDAPSTATLQSLLGFVFHCNNETLRECLRRSTFGSGAKFRRLKVNSPLWLLNYSDNSILGLYYAKSRHTYCDNQLWGGKYKWQVRFGTVFDGKMPLKDAMKLIGRQGTRKPTNLTSDESRLLVDEFVKFYRQRLLREREEKTKAKRVATVKVAKVTSNPNSFAGLDSGESDGEEVRVYELGRRVYWTSTYVAGTSHCYIILTYRFTPRLTAPRFARGRF